ncbi:MAG TPA: hypothetical protein VFM74_02790 [Candidatus Limnocylindria bacterium]|nr:hypothetical protein [Candidatus Limnocylindria bacterium]
MIELLRRVAVLGLLSAAGVGLLAPLSVRSATPVSATTAGLLAAAERPDLALSRTLLDGRERSAGMSLASVSSGSEAETLGVVVAEPTVGAVSFTARIKAAATPRPRPQIAPPPILSGTTVSGKATFYCCTLGYRGQAVVALPGAFGGHYDPPPASRYVTICADRCARLPVVDYCGCHWGTASQKVADLSPEAWAAITDRDRWKYGVVVVTIDLG